MERNTTAIKRVVDVKDSIALVQLEDFALQHRHVDRVPEHLLREYALARMEVAKSL